MARAWLFRIDVGTAARSASVASNTVSLIGFTGKIAGAHDGGATTSAQLAASAHFADYVLTQRVET